MDHYTSPQTGKTDPALLHQTERILGALEAGGDYSVTQLEPQKMHELDDQCFTIEQSVNLKDGRAVHQFLIGVVRAGSDLFGIVHIHASKNRDNTDEIAVTHFEPGARASIIGFVDQSEPLRVGRSYQNGLSQEVSAEHFVVARKNVTKNGGKHAGYESYVIGIGDVGSTNGTELITANPAAGLSSHRLFEDQEWAPRSDDVRAILDTRRPKA
jgi:hypothetical protein